VPQVCCQAATGPAGHSQHVTDKDTLDALIARFAGSTTCVARVHHSKPLALNATSSIGGHYTADADGAGHQHGARCCNLMKLHLQLMPWLGMLMLVAHGD
jgi:hypothetical protein